MGLLLRFSLRMKRAWYVSKNHWRSFALTEVQHQVQGNPLVINASKVSEYHWDRMSTISARRGNTDVRHRCCPWPGGVKKMSRGTCFFRGEFGKRLLSLRKGLPSSAASSSVSCSALRLRRSLALTARTKASLYVFQFK